MGGHIYVLPKFKVYNYFSYRKSVKTFFAAHREFGVVQGHMTSTAGIYLPIAKKAGALQKRGRCEGSKGFGDPLFPPGSCEKGGLLFCLFGDGGAGCVW